jgi:TetR/AcrR family transcriptional regulator
MNHVFHRNTFDRIALDKQRCVLDAAAQEFADRGFAAANINRIAEAAGISVGSLYKYFETKTHLYLEVVNRGLGLIEEALDPILASDDPLEKKIDAILDAIFSGARDYPVMNRLYCRFTAESDSDLSRRLAARLESITAEAYDNLLRQGQRDGVVTSEVDSRILSFCLDNIFLTLQFSLSGTYWKDRMEIYLGSYTAGDERTLKRHLSLFLRQALGLRK